MKGSKRIFISRELTPNSPFQALLEGKAMLEAQSLVEFEAVPIEQLPNCDWLFFYSKKGIDFGWPTLQTLHPQPKIAVLGAASSEYLSKKYDCVADFVGTGAPASTASTFLKVAQGQQVCFVQAQHSRQSIANLLGTQVQAQSLIVYNNSPKTALDIPFCDILVFTSPLNAQAYYQYYNKKENQPVIAIGQTTAKALQALNISSPIIAPAPHERALANCCLSLL